MNALKLILALIVATTLATTVACGEKAEETGHDHEEHEE